MVEGTEPHCFDRVVRAGKSSQHRNRRRMGTAADSAQDLDAIDAGHAQIKQDRIHMMRAEMIQRFMAGRRHLRLVAQVANRLGEPIPHSSIIVDNQDDCHGNSISNVAPSEVETRRASPPCARAISRTMASPSPVPSARPVTKGSNSRSAMAAGTPGPVSLTRRYNLLFSHVAESVIAPPS